MCNSGQDRLGKHLHCIVKGLRHSSEGSGNIFRPQKYVKLHLQQTTFHRESCFTETAINIGYSCQLLTDDLTDVFVVDGTTYDGVETQLLRYLDTIKKASTEKKQPTLSIVTFRWDKKRSGTLKETEYDFYKLPLSLTILI